MPGKVIPSVPVCWLEEVSGKIKWGNMVKTDGGLAGRRTIWMEDGGWNWAEDCFFTENQCRRHHKLPPKEWTDLKTVLAEKLESLAESVRNRKD